MGLQLHGVSKRVGQEVHLKDIDLEFESGSRYVILGRTLAGKTSLLRIMAGLDRPSTGRVLADGQDVTGVSVRKRSVAMVYQQFINYPSQTIYENIASPLKIHGLDKSEIDNRVRNTARMLHIDGMLGRLPAELSGGQQQRTAIARALVKNVDLLLLDEPLVNLDYKLREELRDELQKIFIQRDSVVVYTTTEPTEALMLGGHVIVMHEGKVLQVGPTAEVYQNPATTQVAEVFSDPPINFMHGDIHQGQVNIGESLSFKAPPAMNDLPPGSYTFGIRSSQLNLTCPSDKCASIAGEIGLSEINGSETFIHFTYGKDSLVVQENGIHSVKVGNRVKAYINPGSFYVFNGAGKLMTSPDNA
ncbi:ABC transporter ATP-binding protein [Pseudodesulfovibrio piezophilus]|uniref:ABC transporter related n=1 Tax=Pseudodesulfovibrio piezophilus (strain DSM 21447 / JCM 15486 / C1TLV30) TaxID=1322246 RepID=M1WLH9_PSEP2|nr:ABC transporter ATP-binding protein [Pseudodesulfovibrio piezophilus]CCH47895.1 ABC transporter related [Pseudodesulfovibrio piezophilus C1TLV30]